MKKSLLALAILAGFASAAQAQSNVTIYGELDLGYYHSSGQAGPVMRDGDNDRLGFKGTEDLGGGMSAIYRVELRFDAETGMTEGNGTRPAFQGRTWVGLEGSFGKVRIGRELTAYQWDSADFEPWGELRARDNIDDAGNNGVDGGYASTLSDCGCRWGNSLFYNSPNMSGFTIGATLQTLQSSTSSDEFGGLAKNVSVPVSLSLKYDNGPLKAMLGYEKNFIGNDVWKLAGAYNFGPATLMGSYAHFAAGNEDPSFNPGGLNPGYTANAWHVGGIIPFGANKVLLGFNDVKSDTMTAANVSFTYRTFQIGFEHALSKRTFVYADAATIHTTVDASVGGFAAAGSTNTTQVDVGINHTF